MRNVKYICGTVAIWITGTKRVRDGSGATHIEETDQIGYIENIDGSITIAFTRLTITAIFFGTYNNRILDECEIRIDGKVGYPPGVREIHTWRALGNGINIMRNDSGIIMIPGAGIGNILPWITEGD